VQLNLLVAIRLLLRKAKNRKGGVISQQRQLVD
jgi:hypothetical protein